VSIACLTIYSHEQGGRSGAYASKAFTWLRKKAAVRPLPRSLEGLHASVIGQNPCVAVFPFMSTVITVRTSFHLSQLIGACGEFCHRDSSAASAQRDPEPG